MTENVARMEIWEKDNKNFWEVKVKVMSRPTVSRPVCLGIIIWALRPDLYYCQTVADLLMWGALSDERTGLLFARVTVSSSKPLVSMYVCMYVYTVYTRPRSVQAKYSRSCPIISCSCYNGSLVTSTVVCLAISGKSYRLYSFDKRRTVQKTTDPTIPTSPLYMNQLSSGTDHIENTSSAKQRISFIVARRIYRYIA
jgi:hypothetical protein